MVERAFAKGGLDRIGLDTVLLDRINPAHGRGVLPSEGVVDRIVGKVSIDGVTLELCGVVPQDRTAKELDERVDGELVYGVTDGLYILAVEAHIVVPLGVLDL